MLQNFIVFRRLRLWSDARFGLKAGNESIEGQRTEVFATAGTHGDRACLHLLVADHELVGQLLQAVLADLVADFLVRDIGRDTKARGLETLADLPGIAGLALGDGKHHRLYGREPQRESARVMLDQDADEALHRAD